jgi:hypothetical protein
VRRHLLWILSSSLVLLALIMGAPPALAAPTAPSLTGPPSVTFVVGVTSTYTPVVSGDPIPVITVVSGTLPAGLSLNSTTGVISGAATTPGSTSLTLSADNGVGTAATLPVSITVSTAPTASPQLTITTSALPTATAGTPYRVALAATGGDGSAKVWSLAAGSTLPRGLTLSTAGVLSGTPTTPNMTPSHGGASLTGTPASFALNVHDSGTGVADSASARLSLAVDIDTSHPTTVYDKPGIVWLDGDPANCDVTYLPADYGWLSYVQPDGSVVSANIAKPALGCFGPPFETVTAGQTITVDGGGFAPGDAVTIRLSNKRFPTPTTFALGVVHADAAGLVNRAVVTVPADVPPGAYDEYATSSLGTTSFAHEGQTLAVVAPPLAVVAPPLAETGTAITPLLELAAGLLLLGSMCLIRGRRPAGCRGGLSNSWATSSRRLSPGYGSVRAIRQAPPTSVTAT